jgi:hypothetical protein
MKIALPSLKSILENNVAELKFARRRPKPGEPAARRMLCTNSFELLNSMNGKLLLNYKQPVRTPKYNTAAKNIIITWDILMQDFRSINLDSCNLITAIPIDQFWKYYDEKLRFMTIQEKTRFMEI